MTETFRPLKTSLLCEAYLIFNASSLSDFLTLPFVKLIGVKGLKIKNKTVEFNIKWTFEFIQFMSLVSQFIISCLHAAFNEIYERMTGEKNYFRIKKLILNVLLIILQLSPVKRLIHHSMVQWIVQDLSLMPLVHFLAIPGMIWLDHSLELAFLLQDGVEISLSAKVNAIIFSSLLKWDKLDTLATLDLQKEGPWLSSLLL